MSLSVALTSSIIAVETCEAARTDLLQEGGPSKAKGGYARASSILREISHVGGSIIGAGLNYLWAGAGSSAFAQPRLLHVYICGFLANNAIVLLESAAAFFSGETLVMSALLSPCNAP